MMSGNWNGWRNLGWGKMRRAEKLAACLFVCYVCCNQVREGESGVWKVRVRKRKWPHTAAKLEAAITNPGDLCDNWMVLLTRFMSFPFLQICRIKWHGKCRSMTVIAPTQCQNYQLNLRYILHWNHPKYIKMRSLGWWYSKHSLYTPWTNNLKQYPSQSLRSHSYPL